MDSASASRRAAIKALEINPVAIVFVTCGGVMLFISAIVGLYLFINGIIKGIILFNEYLLRAGILIQHGAKPSEFWLGIELIIMAIGTFCIIGIYTFRLDYARIFKEEMATKM